MTADEFDEVMGWFEVRWPNLRWTSVTVAALFQDLEKHDAVDVWAAVHHLYETGREHAPSPSTIVATTLEERRKSAELERLAMPAKIDEGRMTWTQYAVRTYGEPIRLWEAAERLHQQADTNCVDSRCRVHKERSS